MTPVEKCINDIAGCYMYKYILKHDIDSHGYIISTGGEKDLEKKNIYRFNDYE